MAMTDALADMITRIRNGQQARLSYTVSPVSKIRIGVLEVLKKEGYIREYSLETGIDKKPQVKIELKYSEGKPVIREISRVSKPGRRVYSPINDLPKFYGGLGVTILSTPRGVMSDHQARQENVGGEVLCVVF